MRPLSELQRKSWLRLPLRYPNPEGAREWLRAQPALAGANFDEGGAPVELGKTPFACYHPHQILRMPDALNTFNSPALLDLVGLFLRCAPVLYSLNAWWSFPGEPNMVNVQYFHRDTDDTRPFIALFAYLTDVSMEDGPHQIVEGSHDRARFPAETFTASMGTDYSAKMERRYRPASITGPAGTMFLANTLAIHRGLVPTRSPRLMLWARYGHGRNSNTQNCAPLPVAEVPGALDLPVLRAANRIIVNYS